MASGTFLPPGMKKVASDYQEFTSSGDWTNPSNFRDYSYMYGSAQSRDEAIEAANIAHEFNLTAINGYFDRLESVSDE